MSITPPSEAGHSGISSMKPNVQSEENFAVAAGVFDLTIASYAARVQGERNEKPNGSSK
jgi:hypothetical protein